MAESTEGVIKVGFGTTETEKRAETTAIAAAASARAMIESQYIMAMRNPRDWDVVRQRILKECKRPGFAREAIYHKPIGAGVSGLSIRFAEVALRCMTNLSIETVTKFDDAEKRIVSQAVVDLESNVRITRDITLNKTVERQSVRDGQEVIGRRPNSKGQLIYIIAASEDDLLNKEGSLVSKAMRENVLRLLPGDIRADARAQIVATQTEEIASDPDGQKKAILDAFFQRGVKPAQVKEFLGHEMDALTVAEVATLRELHNAIRDGEANMRDAIENAKEQRGEKAPTPPTESTERAAGSVTQKVSQKIGDVLKTARGAAVEEVPPAEVPPPAAGPGRGRPPKCPACKTNSLKSVVEREQEKCDDCRQKETDAMRDAQGTSVAAHDAEPGGETPVIASEPEPDAVDKLVQRLRFQFMVDTQGNLPEAEISLSELTGGKVQKFEKLADYLRATPEMIAVVTEALAK